ncbi:HD domain-containing protein [Candidatus Margulisiibacteriota bacterium]
MIKLSHEIRDPILNFIKLDNNERKVLDSRPFQRLRYIHQLATTYLLYPGATHKRFEHSLGVMELASRVFDVVTKNENIQDRIRDTITNADLIYWRKVIRMAGLCHDLGHLPFSHAAEDELLPQYESHELITLRIIENSEISDILKEIKIMPEDVAKIALKPKEYKTQKREVEYNDFEAILSEIITGDAFGVDRIDYLLRDSHHAGVMYGKFDHYRLIDTLRILPSSEDDSSEPMLGIEEGGVHSAEALCLARYYMFSQLYFHPIRRIYDIQLKDFMKQWLPDGKFSTNIEEHLKMTDNEIISEMRRVADDETHKAHEEAKKLIYRKHFKRIYTLGQEDMRKNIDILDLINNGLIEKYGKEKVEKDEYIKPGVELDFPILSDDKKIIPSSEYPIFKKSPDLTTGYIFVDSEIKTEAKLWIDNNKDRLLKKSNKKEE